MPYRSFLCLSIFLLCQAVLAAQDQVFSGPQPGEKLTPFKVLGSSGPHAGKEVELLEQVKGKPVLLVFVHEVTRPAFQLLRPLDQYGTKLAADGLATHFVWLSADKTETEAFLTRAKDSLRLQAPISISLDGREGPGNYGLNRKVTLTVLLAKDNKVVANFAIVQPNETDAPKVLAEVAKLMGRKPPTPEELGARRPEPGRPMAEMPEQLRQLQEEVNRLKMVTQRAAELQRQVDELTDALNEVRGRLAKAEGQQPPPPVRKRPPLTAEGPGRAPMGGAELPGRSSSDPELVGLMRRMIQPDNDEAKVKEITEAMKKWAGDDAARKKELAEFCKRVAHLGYGSEPAKKAVKQLAEN